MRTGLLLLLLAAPALAQDGGVSRGVNGPVAGTHCTTRDDCKLSGLTCSTDQGTSTWPTPEEGGACGCVKNVCHYVWIEPIACSRDSDCALATEPVVHPVRAPPSKKKAKPFRPCKDGEREPICDPTSRRCVVRGWKC